VADRDEHTGQIDRVGGPVCGGAQTQLIHPAVVTQDLVDRVIPADAHLAGFHAIHQVILQDLLAAQPVASMDERHVRGDVGKIESLLDRGVATTDHRDFLAAEEEAIARRAGGNALALECLF
jgi:hypothetical protein